MTLCKQCEKTKINPLAGVYSFACLECCTRLVLSAYPSKPHAAYMLAAIERFRGNPGRDKVLESVRLGLEKRRSVEPR